MQEFDAVVVGTGQGGSPLAQVLAKAGKRTAIIERDQVGGSCVNYGCTPTKTMVASARVAYLARRAGDYGVNTGEIAVDLKKVRERKRATVEQWRSGSEKGIARTDGLTLLRGNARFDGPGLLHVDGNDGSATGVRSPLIVLSTGTRALTPNIPGLDAMQPLDHRSIMELGDLPEHLVIVGGGYIGLEFGQMFRRFGSRVTIIHRHSHLLRGEDEDITEVIAEILREDGIELLLESSPVSVTPDGNAPDGKGIILRVKGPHDEQRVSGSHLMLATGRVPNSDTLNLGSVGIKTDRRGFIAVNDKLETSAEGVYAIGDVKGGPAFTHVAYDDFRVLRRNLLEGGNASIRDRLVPYTVFIDPQLGRVGLTEAQARSKGHQIRVAKLPMASVARAMEMDETRGMMKAVVDATSGNIVGASILGVEGGEIATALQMAMMGGLPYTRVRDGVFSHPTLSESLNNLFMKMESGG